MEVLIDKHDLLCTLNIMYILNVTFLKTGVVQIVKMQFFTNQIPYNLEKQVVYQYNNFRLSYKSNKLISSILSNVR